MPNVESSGIRLSARDWFAVFFGLFLGLALLKFGNPVVLESKISVPKTPAEFLSYAWPPKWSLWFLAPLTLYGLVLGVSSKPRWPGSRWLWILPIVWLGWQGVAATQTVDSALTGATLWHFAALVGCYFTGVLVLGDDRCLKLLLIGLLASFAFCLVRSANQKFVEFPQEYRFLTESERVGWTNVPPEILLEMKQEGSVITTNGIDVANPVLVKKYEKGRTFGTLVYPNALAGAVLLLFPVSIVLAVSGTRRFRPMTRWVGIGLTLFLGVGALFWTGSKSGWLIALILIGIWLFRLIESSRVKWTALAMVVLVGLGFFGIRFKSYFATGATSVSARLDYWRAAVQTTVRNPVFGTGPGTFQRPYEQIKAPEAEMARLTHNDYLEQFSDSGLVGGLAYATWVILLVTTMARRAWKTSQPVHFAIFLGCLGWFIQGFSEFGLYVPALAWTAFLLGGILLGVTGNQIDKPKQPH
ncbi:MAG TPA: O-antigen ligase family protein [Candidatus Paceibacterota bacterium]|nr:O-antigen ligase family protein [Candidatus Paceibacterota bacterium]